MFHDSLLIIIAAHDIGIIALWTVSLVKRLRKGKK
jgi:hypothetical protein